MIPFLKWLTPQKESRESRIRGEIATLERVAKYCGSSDDGARRRAALVEELAAMQIGSQCADCNGTRKVDGRPCPVCCPADDEPGKESG